jgi:hypothetical protein
VVKTLRVCGLVEAPAAGQAMEAEVAGVAICPGECETRVVGAG